MTYVKKALTAHQMIQLVDGVPGLTKYSGRCMYGKHCVALIPENDANGFSDIARIAIAAERAGLAQAFEAEMRGTRQDSMGRGVVIYWPDIEWPADVPDPDRDNDEDDDEV